jgi:hypothetical protein
VGASITPGTTVRPSYLALLREPLTWAAIAALVGNTAALAGTLSWLAWESALSASSRPIPAPRGSPRGPLPRATFWPRSPSSGPTVCSGGGRGGHGGVRPAPREACRLLRPLFGAWDAGAAAGLRRATLHPFPVAPCLHVARTRSYAAVGTERHLQRGQVATRGALLLGLGACGQPLVFAYETLPGEDFYLSGDAVLLLGWPSGGINLPEAALFAVLALLLLRGAHQQALHRLWEDIARENQEKTRRLYEEGLGRGDLSSLNNTVSEDFRDLRHSERLANLTGQGHGSHLHLTFESDHRSEE